MVHSVLCSISCQIPSVATPSRARLVTAALLLAVLILLVNVETQAFDVRIEPTTSRATAATATAATATAASVTAATATATVTVAVGFCGYLNLGIPQRGATARTNVIQPLQADVLVAGTYKTSDCGGGPGYHCLWAKLSGLGPLAGRSLSRKLADDEIRTALLRTPHFATVARAFRMDHTFHGITNWTPILGSSKAHMIHQIRDYALLLDLIRRTEGERGAFYERIIFSRLEFAWLAPHPPLSLLSPSMLWIPYGSPRMNDRHVVMNRSHADVWMGRWALFCSDALLDTLPLLSLAHDGPEELIENLLIARGITVGEFPGTAYLPCCPAADACALQGGFCYERRLGFCVANASTVEALATPAGRAPTLQRTAAGTACAHASGKYQVEVGLAVAHSTELACTSGQFTLLTATVSLPKARTGMGRWVCTDRCFWSLDGLTPSTPQVYQGRLGIVAKLPAPSALPAAFPCMLPPPLQRDWLEAATWASERAGYCAPTDTGDAGDCEHGQRGSWRLNPWMRGWTSGIYDEYSCVRHCVRSCTRCRFVSVSMVDGDCSWYSGCEMGALQTQLSRGHKSFAIRRGHGATQL